MKSKTIQFCLYCILSVIAFSSCTHNNGDIGPWFGIWHVENIEIDGQNMTDYKGDYFVLFQTNVVSIIQRVDYNDAGQSFGQWQAEAGTLTIDFPDSNVLYCNLPGMTEHNQFTVEKLSSSRITLALVDINGHTYRYLLKKWT